MKWLARLLGETVAMATDKTQSLMRRSRRPAAIIAFTLLSVALFSSQLEARDSTQPEATFRVTGDLLLIPLSMTRDSS